MEEPSPSATVLLLRQVLFGGLTRFSRSSGAEWRQGLQYVITYQEVMTV